MAKRILISNPVTIDLANRLSGAVGKSPHNTADWFLQQTLRHELRIRGLLSETLDKTQNQTTKDTH